MQTHDKRKAYVFPLILLATFSIGIFISTVGQLQVSHKKQFNHLNQYRHSFNIAYSALVELLADLKKKKWSNRSFKTKPVYYTKSLYSGVFNLLVEDHATEDLVFNVKVRVTYSKKSTLFYWRLKYEPNLLDFNTLVIPKYYGHFPNSTKPDYNSELDKIVDDSLKARDENKAKSDEIVIAINNKSKIKEILTQIGAIKTGSPLDILGQNDTRESKVVIEFDPNKLSARNITDIIDETSGADTPRTGDVIAMLPLTDIYPDKINVNIGLSRKEIVVYFCRILRFPENSSAFAIAKFPDITEDNTFNRALSPMCETGIIKGYTDGTFAPDDKILRGHMGFLLKALLVYIEPQINDPDISTTKRRELRIIQEFSQANYSDYYNINPLVAMSVGDGLSVLADLLEKINSAT